MNRTEICSAVTILMMNPKIVAIARLRTHCWPANVTWSLTIESKSWKCTEMITCRWRLDADETDGCRNVRRRLTGTEHTIGWRLRCKFDSFDCSCIGQRRNWNCRSLRPLRRSTGSIRPALLQQIPTKYIVIQSINQIIAFNQIDVHECSDYYLITLVYWIVLP